ncbi:hypothetical protein DASC09_062580 [Saccharomycopsis crataegensis]|uniref:Uncharacterized protein n=1 Tax=Saccharomycopsis crataegensis TaxID=43959 RepID=A0AAV5QW40_9ASCO|nr:hypothetical protein DASC09_062580 [Saccharomycopsis crataegensis]
MRQSLLRLSGHGAKYVRHAEVPYPKVPAFYRYSAKLLGATMWFWIFYRAKQDYKVWFGMKLPFEH